jgi:hypothetical protein
MDIMAVCEMICTGTLQIPKFKLGDVPLRIWRPHVFVFANFHPEIISAHDMRNWTLSLPTQMNHTGHLIVPRAHLETLVEAAKRYFSPVPEVVGMEDLIESLRAVLRDFRVSPGNLPGAFKTVEAAACAMLSVFTPGIMMEYWRRGYEPMITLYSSYARSLEDGELPDLVLAEETVPFTERTPYSSIIGKTGQIGNVFIRSRRLTETGRAIAAKKIAEMASSLPTLELIDGVLGPSGKSPLTILQGAELGSSAPAATNMGPFDEKGGEFPDFGYADDQMVFRTLGDFLSAYRPLRFRVPTPTPVGEIRTNGWLLEARRIFVEIDFELPSKGEAYRMIYWLEQGYRTIRMRADDVGVEWRNGMSSTVDLERAIMDSSLGDFVYLDRIPGRNSWRELRENIGIYGSMLAGHDSWWVKHVGPLPRSESVENDELEDNSPLLDDEYWSGPTAGSLAPLPAPEAMRAVDRCPQEVETATTRSSPEIPSIVSPVRGDPCDTSRVCREPDIGGVRWAIYCRTASGSDDLFAQRNYCLAHANICGLSPVEGPRNYFEDFCSAETCPGERPGLQAFLNSGATGMLCAHVSLLADAANQTAAIGFLLARGVVFRAVP